MGAYLTCYIARYCQVETRARLRPVTKGVMDAAGVEWETMEPINWLVVIVDNSALGADV